LRQRNEFKNRPVKVEVVPRGAKVILKGNNNTGEEDLNAAFINEDGDFDFEGSYFSNGYHNQQSPLESEVFESSNGESVHSMHAKTPIGRPQRQYAKTPAGRPQQRQSSRIRNDRILRQRRMANAIDEAKREFKDYVLKDPQRFNINPVDQSIVYPSSGRSLNRANLDEIIDRLVNPNMENKPSPIGTQLVGRPAFDDPILRALMLTRFNRNRGDEETPEDIGQFLSAEGSLLRNPRPGTSNGSGSQAGGGLGYMQKKKKGASHYFRPQLWSQGRRK
jgi:hypothetical protein